MKLTILAFLLSCISSVAYANDPVITEKSVVCYDTKKVFESLFKKYKEIPLWTGIDGNDHYAVTVNKDTKTWTIIQFNHEIACVIGNGERYELIFQKPNA